MNNSTIKRLRSNDEGFDLIQLLIVVVILGALATIAVLALLPQLTKGDEGAVQANLNSGINAARLYQVDNAGSDTNWSGGATAAAAAIESATNNKVTADPAATNPNTSPIDLESTSGSVTGTATVSPDTSSTGPVLP